MGTGMARGARERGELVALGCQAQRKIIWDHNSEVVFRDNPNLLRPDGLGRVNGLTVKWIEFYRGHRLYNRDDSKNERWVWNMDFRPQPGEVYFSREEITVAVEATKELRRAFVLIEPNVAPKRVGPNKQWAVDRYQWVADQLRRDGHEVAQFEYAGMTHVLKGARMLPSKTFRRGMALLARAGLVITAEGGLHHAAAALDVPAVVIFGGFVPPQVTGYPQHENLAVGEACGKYVPCDHCRRALHKIDAEQVYEAAQRLLSQTEAV